MLEMCVNALSRAFFISTLKNVVDLAEKKVSMPSVVLSSFLRFKKSYAECNGSVSMPSVVLSSFLRKYKNFQSDGTEWCQCPQSCFLHFYMDLNLILSIALPCQCPQSCFLHFYDLHRDEQNEYEYAVSMPSVVLSSFLRKNYYVKKFCQ